MTSVSSQLTVCEQDVSADDESYGKPVPVSLAHTQTSCDQLKAARNALSAPNCVLAPDLRNRAVTIMSNHTNGPTSVRQSLGTDQ